jgi:heat shock protein HslJ
MTASQSAETRIPLDGTAWTLAALPGKTLAGNSNVTLQFDADRVSGADGCNRYSGSYVVNNSALRVSALASTQMACAPELMTQAKAFTSALTDARSYRIADGQLALIGPDGVVVATLVALSRELAGTSWSATGINNGKQAVVGLVQGTSVTLAFGADGRATGSAGCNSYTAAYSVDGSNLKFARAAATRKMCAQPDVMDQEIAFLKALETVATARLDGDQLELRTAGDALALFLKRVP